MNCVTAEEVSLVFNGRSDGFFKLEFGLRQGCALSPYLFILSMDILSRGLQFMSQHNIIKGVKLAPSAPPLTNCLYADDLLIFGAADGTEATIIHQVLLNFMQYLGQQIGADKSHIWYSGATPEENKTVVSSIFGVVADEGVQKYLGAPASEGRSAYDFLTQKFSVRLQA